MKKHWLQILVAIMLLCSFGTWPYSFYQLLRWVVSISAGLLAYRAFNTNKENWGWIFIVILVLFNPIAPIYMQRETWQIIDLVTAIIFLISMRKVSMTNHS